MSSLSTTPFSSNAVDQQAISPSRFWQYELPVGLMWLVAAIFGVVGGMRLNTCEWFNPDSPRYVMYSRGLVATGEYRSIDLPGEPFYSWRPPGLPLLLAPAAWFRPFDVEAAKVIVLLTGVLLVIAVGRWVRELSGPWPALCVSVILASSPLSLTLSTEVMAEVPFALLSVLVLCSVAVQTRDVGQRGVLDQNAIESSTGWRVMCILALGFLPLVRTIGVALIAAAALWALFHRGQRRLWWAVLAALVVVGVWSFRNSLVGANNYADSIFETLKTGGLAAVLAKVAANFQYYIGAWPDLLLPGLNSATPAYSMLTVNSAPHFGSFAWITAIVSAVLVGVAVMGALSRRMEGGSLVILYAMLYCGCVLVWPWRDERFLWPLVPAVWAFLPSGLSVLSPSDSFSTAARFSGAARFSLLRTGGLIAAACLVIWQICGQMSLVRTNERFTADAEQFRRDFSPNFYFTDWRAAGAWLNKNTPPNTRVLTWHAAVGETSRRYQRRVQFEALSPTQIRQQIQEFGARYLVVPNAQFGDGFHWQQIDSDPGYTFRVVHDAGDAAVIFVEPNRTGVASAAAYERRLNSQLDGVNTASQRWPGRSDLALRRATLLREAGRLDEALVLLQQTIDAGDHSVRAYSDFGWALFESGRFADAAEWLQKARTRPYAEAIDRELAAGAELARQRATAGPTDANPYSEELKTIRGELVQLKLAAAARSADKLLAAAPNLSDAHYLRGVVDLWTGDSTAAAARFETALALGSADAQKKLLMMRWSEAIGKTSTETIRVGAKESMIDPGLAENHVKLADLFVENNMHGRALATLEAADVRLPGQPLILKSLVARLLDFGMAEDAMQVIVRWEQAAGADNEDVKASRVLVERLLLVPRFAEADRKPE